MKPNSNKQPLFTGLVFRGLEFLPKDIIPTWGNIRGWAFKHKLIQDPESQLITLERIEELKKHFVYEDNLSILIHLYKDSSGKLEYFEYPYLPVKTLIKKAIEAEIVYWQMVPTALGANGTIKEYSEVHFGFWYPSIGSEEFQSISNARLIVKKFRELFNKLPGVYQKNKLNNGILDVAVDGDVKAIFFKTGRLFNVKFIFKK